MATFSGRGGASLSRAQASGTRANAFDASRTFDASRAAAAATTRESQLQLLSSARMTTGGPAPAPAPAAQPAWSEPVPSITAASTALTAEAERSLADPTPEEPAPAVERPAPREGEFSRMYRERKEREREQQQAQERRAAGETLDTRWEKLEAGKATREMAQLRQLVDEMSGSVSEMRRQIGAERSARLVLEQQLADDRDAFDTLRRSHEKQAAELRVGRKRQGADGDPESRIAALEHKVGELDASLIEEGEERERMSDLLRDAEASKRALSERVKQLEQQVRRTQEKGAHEMKSMQDECLSQVESMSRMLDVGPHPRLRAVPPLCRPSRLRDASVACRRWRLWLHAWMRRRSRSRGRWPKRSCGGQRGRRTSSATASTLRSPSRPWPPTSTRLRCPLSPGSWSRSRRWRTQRRRRKRTLR